MTDANLNRLCKQHMVTSCNSSVTNTTVRHDLRSRVWRHDLHSQAWPQQCPQFALTSMATTQVPLETSKNMIRAHFKHPSLIITGEMIKRCARHCASDAFVSAMYNCVAKARAATFKQPASASATDVRVDKIRKKQTQ